MSNSSLLSKISKWNGETSLSWWGDRQANMINGTGKYRTTYYLGVRETSWERGGKEWRRVRGENTGLQHQQNGPLLHSHGQMGFVRGLGPKDPLFGVPHPLQTILATGMELGGGELRRSWHAEGRRAERRVWETLHV